MSIFLQNKPSVTIVVTPYDDMHRANVLSGDQEKASERDLSSTKGAEIKLEHTLVSELYEAIRLKYHRCR